MAELKTKPTNDSVDAYIDAISDERTQRDCRKLLALMKRVTGEKPRLWMNQTVGFGTYHYKYPSGQEGDWFITGFAPRKANLTLYIMPGFTEYGDLMAKLGKHKTGKSCLYIKSLDDVDMSVLEELVDKSVSHMRRVTAS